METVEPKVGRVVKIWWFFMWRTVLFSTIAGVVVGFLLGLLLLFVGMAETTKQGIAEIIGLLITVPVGIWVMSQLFDKQFSDFRIVLLPKEPSPPAEDTADGR